MCIRDRPKNSIIKQYKELFALDNIEFEISEEALEAIAKKAKESGTGARGLRSQFEKILMNTMFEAPSLADPCRVKVDQDSVLSGLDPKIEHLKQPEEGKIRG